MQYCIARPSNPSHQRKNTDQQEGVLCLPHLQISKQALSDHRIDLHLREWHNSNQNAILHVKQRQSYSSDAPQGVRICPAVLSAGMLSACLSPSIHSPSFIRPFVGRASEQSPLVTVLPKLNTARQEAEATTLWQICFRNQAAGEDRH